MKEQNEDSSKTSTNGRKHLGGCFKVMFLKLKVDVIKSILLAVFQTYRSNYGLHVNIPECYILLKY